MSLLSQLNRRVFSRSFNKTNLLSKSALPSFQTANSGDYKKAKRIKKPKRFSWEKYGKDGSIIPPPVDANAVLPSIDDEGYRIVAGTIVCRLPIIYRAFEPYEEAYNNFKLERKEKTHIPLPDKISGLEFAKKMKTYDEIQLDIDEYVPNPRITDEDISGDRKSLNRRLESNLYLIVKKPRTEHAWQFPQGGFKPSHDGSILECAKRELREECGENFGAYFVGNAPLGVLQYDYPEGTPQAKDAKGAKVFFMYAVHMCYYPELDMDEVVDYRWVTADEFHEYFEPDLLERTKIMCNDVGTGWIHQNRDGMSLNPY